MTVQPAQLPPAEGHVQEAAPEVRARVFGLYADTWSRLVMVLVIAIIFVGLNYSVMLFVERVFDADLKLLQSSPSTSRVITTEVVMSLIGATVIQVGVAIIAIVSYLFPKK